VYKKIIAIILLLAMITSCSSKKINSYNITKNSYLDNNIRIDYPQMEDNKNKEKVTRLNKLIREEALKIIDYYKYNDISSLTIDYEISYKNPKILSIKYFGLGYQKSSLYPNNIFYTTNLNIIDENLLQLTDIIDIDESLIINEDIKPLKNEHKDVLKHLSIDELIEKFSNANFYLTNNALGISIDVIHAIGDHAEYEISYDSISGEKWNNFTQTFINIQ